MDTNTKAASLPEFALITERFRSELCKMEEAQRNISVGVASILDLRQPQKDSKEPGMVQRGGFIGEMETLLQAIHIFNESLMESNGALEQIVGGN